MKRLYLVTCALCKQQRTSTKDPSKGYAPKSCARCNRGKNRVHMARMMRREPLLERT